MKAGRLVLTGVGIFLAADILLLFFLFSDAPGEKTKRSASISMERLLTLAVEPVGKTMYIWGGGWNKEDTGAGRQTRSLGLSPFWKTFADQQTKDYDYRKTRYQNHAGLDCSGYIGWVIYNLMETKDGREGYVQEASGMAEDFARRGWGEFEEAGEVSDWKAGDIMSMEDHVWMVLGSCEDGSVVLLHSSPPGVRLCGTRLPDQTEEVGEGLERKRKSEAEVLAEEYMCKYYPDWYRRYPESGCPYRYLTDSASMRWSSKILADPYGLREKTAEEVLEWLFSHNEKESKYNDSEGGGI